MTVPSDRRTSRHRAFTLIELLIVIAIIAILSVVVVLTLNPTGTFAQSRDQNRLGDMDTLAHAISLFQDDAAIVNGAGSMGTANTVYVSLPDPNATTTAGSNCTSLNLPILPTGYGYHCAGPSFYRKVDGTGWIPVNFSGMSTGSPVGTLPVDPVNSSSSRLYYTYTTNGSRYETTSVMESAKYGLGGTNDVISPDGGTLASVYEKGSQLGLEPLDYGDSSLVGYWTFDEGSGGTAWDWSGMGRMGTFIGSGQNWAVGRVNGALGMTNSGTINYAVPSTSTLPSAAVSVSAWINGISYASFSNHLYDTVSDGNATWNLYSYAGGNFAFNIVNGGLQHNAACSSVSAGQWHFLVGTYNGNLVRLYLDGTSCGTYVDSGAILSQSVTAFTSNVGSGGNYFLDDIRIYNRALSAAQISAMYAGGK
jgi:prepilin-type N-terminal cleavage/methylation domain-containing protein